MSPNSPAEAAAAFAATLDISWDPSADPDVRMCELIETARQTGLSWAQIGSVIIGRRDPKAAKKHAKALGAAVRARAFASMPLEVNGA